jgi:Type III restriction enzyme, res subunit
VTSLLICRSSNRVASIGFPAEFASAPETKREAEETISGPIDLPPLHDFQKEVMQALQALLASSRKRRRAVVRLSTGGGKTRVTVEASVRLVLAPEGDRRGVIWVAQTDELCEQAVQAFRQVWVNLGAQSTDLRIVRLWSGNPNPAIQAPDRPVVVVASNPDTEQPDGHRSSGVATQARSFRAGRMPPRHHAKLQQPTALAGCRNAAARRTTEGRAPYCRTERPHRAHLSEKLIGED